jgi:hypothetical protein
LHGRDGWKEREAEQVKTSHLSPAGGGPYLACIARKAKMAIGRLIYTQTQIRKKSLRRTKENAFEED